MKGKAQEKDQSRAAKSGPTVRFTPPIILVALMVYSAALLFARVGPASAYPPKGVTGDADPAVTQATIKTTICVPNYTARVRAVTEATKREILKRDDATEPVEIDHFLSLELAGTNDPDKNLWAESYIGQYGARTKDVVETALHRMVCRADDPMPLKVAQKCITSDWIRCGKQIGVLSK